MWDGRCCSCPQRSALNSAQVNNTQIVGQAMLVTFPFPAITPRAVDYMGRPTGSPVFLRLKDLFDTIAPVRLVNMTNYKPATLIDDHQVFGPATSFTDVAIAAMDGLPFSMMFTFSCDGRNEQSIPFSVNAIPQVASAPDAEGGRGRRSGSTNAAAKPLPSGAKYTTPGCQGRFSKIRGTVYKTHPPARPLWGIPSPVTWRDHRPRQMWWRVPFKLHGLEVTECQRWQGDGRHRDMVGRMANKYCVVGPSPLSPPPPSTPLHSPSLPFSAGPDVARTAEGVPQRTEVLCTELKRDECQCHFAAPERLPFSTAASAPVPPGSGAYGCPFIKKHQEMLWKPFHWTSVSNSLQKFQSENSNQQPSV